MGNQWAELSEQSDYRTLIDSVRNKPQATLSLIQDLQQSKTMTTLAGKDCTTQKFKIFPQTDCTDHLLEYLTTFASQKSADYNLAVVVGFDQRFYKARQNGDTSAKSACELFLDIIDGLDLAHKHIKRNKTIDHLCMLLCLFKPHSINTADPKHSPTGTSICHILATMGHDQLLAHCLRIINKLLQASGDKKNCLRYLNNQV